MSVITVAQFEDDLKATMHVLAFVGYNVKDALKEDGKPVKKHTVSKVVDIQRPWGASITLEQYRAFNRKVDAFLVQLEMLNLKGEPKISEVEYRGERFISVAFTASLSF